MRPGRSIGQIAALWLSFSTVSAMAWPGFLPHIDALVVREDSTSEDTTTTAATKTDNSETATITKGPQTTNLNTATIATGDDKTATSDGEDDSKGNSTTTTTKKKTFDSRSPAGGVSMIEPITTTMILYKLGDYVTLSWNYTSLLAEPTAVDVLAVDASATQTHTLTQNMTFEDPASFTWDTEAYQNENAVTKALRVAEYTLYIYDSEGEPTGTAAAGYLAPYNQLSFGIYTPVPYEPLGEWVCAVCNGASGRIVAGAATFAVTLAFGAGVALVVL